MDNNVMFDLSDRLKALKDKKKEIETSLKGVNDMIFEVEAALAELMTLSETHNFTRSGTMFSLTTSTKASTKAGRKDELYALLKDAGGNGYAPVVAAKCKQVFDSTERAVRHRASRPRKKPFAPTGIAPGARLFRRTCSR